MKLPKRDLVATVLVAVAIALYLLWAADAAPPGLDGVRATGLVILGLGFAASASAVVPGFDQLIHGNKMYLASTSAIGVAAFVAGLVMLLATSETALAVLMIAMVVLWAMSTAHHVMLAHPRAPVRSMQPPRPAAMSH
jgi:hypothetical protein